MHPYVMIEPNGASSINLLPYFTGFFGQNGKNVAPTFSLDEGWESSLIAPHINGNILTVETTKPNTESIGSFNVTVNDGETTYVRHFGVDYYRRIPKKARIRHFWLCKASLFSSPIFVKLYTIDRP